MWTMGDDFQYQYAESWFKQMDKFIHYVNKVLYVEGFQLSEFNHSNTFLIELKIWFKNLTAVWNLSIHV